MRTLCCGVITILTYAIASTLGLIIEPTFSNSTHEIYQANISWTGDVITCGTQFCSVECSAESICDYLQINPSLSESISLTCGSLACRGLQIVQPSTISADISCIGDGSCYDSRFVLTTTPTINLLCGDSSSGWTAKGSCQSSELRATNAMNVNIICGGTGEHMCLATVFHLQSVSNVVTITANGYRALSRGAQIVYNWPGANGIMAHNANKLIINCMSADACYDMAIYPPYKSEYAFSLQCADQDRACGDSSVASFSRIIVNNSNFATNFLDLYCTRFLSETSCDIRLYCPYNAVWGSIVYSVANGRYQCYDSVCCPWDNYDFISKIPTTEPTSSPIITTNGPSQPPTNSINPSLSPTENPTLSPTEEANEESNKVDAFAFLSGTLLTILIVGAVTLLICIFIIFMWLYAKNMRAAKEKEIIIKNALVIFLAIGEYNYPAADDADEELKNAYLPNLEIDVDLSNLSQLFGAEFLNYTIYPNYDETTKTQWTQDEIITLLTDKANLLEANVNKFDGLLVAISSHGVKDHICCSDYKLIEKLAVHRIFSQNHPLSREIPRIFLFDCCDGDKERGKNIKIRNTNTVKEALEDRGKNYTVEQIEKLESVIWKHDTKNPDHRLVEINAANPGFQSKLSTVKGSYLLHGFVKKMIDDLNYNRNQYIHEIFDDLQSELQEQGKQLTKNTYNNGTRYIKLRRNNNNTPAMQIMQ